MPERSDCCTFALLQPRRRAACYEIARLARYSTEPLAGERRLILS
jgi:hypothetical protein